MSDFAIGSFLGFMAGMWTGLLLLDAKWMRDAVKHNAAEFYLDKNNKRRWRWRWLDKPKDGEQSE